MNWLLVSVGEIPLLVRRGGCATNKISRSLRSRRRRGGRSPKILPWATTPSAPIKEASRHFLMSRPPLLTRRGLSPT